MKGWGTLLLVCLGGVAGIAGVAHGEPDASVDAPTAVVDFTEDREPLLDAPIRGRTGAEIEYAPLMPDRYRARSEVPDSQPAAAHPRPIVPKGGCAGCSASSSTGSGMLVIAALLVVSATGRASRFG